MFGELIIMVVYLPILTLEGIEGKMFRPMALTVIFALAASLVLSMTLIPVLASFGLPRRIKRKQTLADRWAHAVFQPVLRLGLRYPWTTLLLTIALTAITIVLGFHLGVEFVPRLNEGSVVINTVRLSGVSLEESVRYGDRMEKLLMAEFPREIEHVWTRTGTPEIATDPMGLELSDIFIMLTPREQWKQAKSQDELVKKMAQAMQRLPGTRALLTQPIEMRINEMIAGIRSDVGIKIYGDDLEAIKTKAKEFEAVLKQIPGAMDVFTEQITGQPIERALINDEAVARYGVARSDVLAIVESVGGIHVGEIREGQRRFPLVVKLAQQYRDDPDALSTVVVPTAGGQRIPLTQLLTF
jgi:cobalt-zinc-cadmium resistance protein CzcA